MRARQLVILPAVLASSLAVGSAAPAAKRSCDLHSFGTEFCATHYQVGIANVKLGQSASRVRKVLGGPRSQTKGTVDLCPFTAGDQIKIRPRVQRYPDHLTVHFQRLSHTENICSTRGRNRERTVSKIVTTSPRDKFANGVHVGSTARFAKRAFKAQHIVCHVGGKHQAKGAGYCVLAVQQPRWARRDTQVIAALLLHVKRSRIVRVELTLHKAYS